MKVSLVLPACVATAIHAAAQDPIDTAKDLYASAAYEDALAALTRLHGNDAASSEQVEQYRAFCLFALGRTGEAQAVAEALVSASALLAIDASAASPRIVALFTDVRRRLMPELIRNQYRSGKAAIEEKNYSRAQSQFGMVRQLLDEAKKIGLKDEGLSDVGVLADGFLELAQAAQLRRNYDVGEQPKEPLAHASDATSVPTRSEPPAIYTAGMEGVVAPKIVRQYVPSLPRELVPMLSGASRTTILDIIIGADGSVEQAVVRQSGIRMYDSLLAAEARSWKYQPAMKDDRPVKFLKTLEIVVKTGTGRERSVPQ